MADHTRKRLLIVCFLVALMVLIVALAGQAIAGVTVQASQPKTIDRNREPVVVKGSLVSGLIGAPVEDLFVYVFSGDSLNGQIPVQIDEVTATGSYTTGNGLLDLDDEIVFMVDDLGALPSDTSLLTSTLPISSTWYQIEVADPLNPAEKGWAYLVRSGDLSPSFSGDYADVVSSVGDHITIDADHYELRMPTAYEGIDYLALNTGGDILDRTKLRVVMEVSSIPMTVTEQSLLNPTITFLKDGKVRVILQRTIQQDFSPIVDVSLHNTYLVYASLLQTTSHVDFELGSSTTLSKIRSSLDLRSTASGATFYNDNTPGGVTINGLPDVVDETPFSNWTQISHSSGRLIQVGDPSPAGGTPRNYYCDNSDPDTSDPECDGTEKTGDYRSYGDSGVLIDGAVNSTFTLKSWFFVLGSGTNVGATYEEYYSNPLIIVPSRPGRPKIFLPIIRKNS